MRTRHHAEAAGQQANAPTTVTTPDALVARRLVCVSGGIFLLRGEDDLVPMTEASYDTEDVLQALLAKFPDLLAGDQLAGIDARRWVLIDRESAVPDTEEGARRWSVDHLFLDQDGVPTLVEVKRSSDTRLRREVVGQLIDYAANAVVYWPIDTLRTTFERRLEREERDADTELAAVLGPDADTEGYWEQAAANLKAGRIRLVFVADEIPRELRRVVEFLNEQMVAEVIAIEVKQYVGPEGLRTLVPRVIGQTAAAETRKGSREKRQWDEASFLAELKGKCSPVEARVAGGLIEWARVQLPRFTWGTGLVTGSFIPVLDHGGQNYAPLALWTNGRVEILFKYLSRRPPFDDVGLRREFLRRLNEIPGIAIPEHAITRTLSLRLAVLIATPETLDSFKGVLEWFCETVRADPGGSPITNHATRLA
jgi:hypothetical protein